MFKRWLVVFLILVIAATGLVSGGNPAKAADFGIGEAVQVFGTGRSLIVAAPAQASNTKPARQDVPATNGSFEPLASVFAEPVYNTGFLPNEQLDDYSAMTADQIQSFLTSDNSYFRQPIRDMEAQTFDPSVVIAPVITAQDLDSYLAGENSPLAGQGVNLIDTGRQHDVDPRLVVAIAGAESTLGKNGKLCYGAVQRLGLGWWMAGLLDL